MRNSIEAGRSNVRIIFRRHIGEHTALVTAVNRIRSLDFVGPTKRFCQRTVWQTVV